MKKALLGVAFLFLVLAAHGTAKADTATFTDWVKFQGAGAGTPALSVTIEDIAVNTVSITMDATTLLGSDKITEWYFNVTVGVGTSPVYSSGQNGSVLAASDTYKADGDGRFDILFQFPTSGDTFVAGDMSVWTLTFAGLTANHFSTLSAPEGGSGPFFSAVKLGNAFWAPGSVNGETVEVNVPEPGTLTLLGMGLCVAGVFRKRFE